MRWWDGNAWTPAWWTPPLSPEEQAARRGAVRPKLRTALFFVIGGLLIVIPAFAFAAREVVDRIDDIATFDVPGAASVHLDHGEYEVFTDLPVSQITVRHSAGDSIPVRSRFGGETVTRNGDSFERVAVFDVRSDGLYVITIDTDFQGSPGSALVTHSIGETFRELAPYVFTALAGGALFIVGIVLLIVGTVRRDKVRYERPPV